MKIIAAVIGGFIVAFASDAYFYAAFVSGDEYIYTALVSGEGYIAMLQKGWLSFPRWWWLFCLIVVWGAAIFVGMRSASAAKAWRKLLICAGILSLLHPIAYLVVWAKVGVAFTNPQEAVAVLQGMAILLKSPNAFNLAALQTALVISAVISVLIGVVCLIIGLLVGKDPQVVYITPNPPPT